jgi:hypothetical protein
MMLEFELAVPYTHAGGMMISVLVELEPRVTVVMIPIFSAKETF